MVGVCVGGWLVFFDTRRVVASRKITLEHTDLGNTGFM